MTEAKQVLVPFNGTQIMVIDDGVNRSVVMKPFVEEIGLEWKNIYPFVAGDEVLKQGIGVTPIPTPSGVQEMTTLDMKYVSLFLAKLNPKRYKHKPEVMAKLIKYQVECADVLYQYFSKGCVFTLQGFKNWLGSLNLMERFKILNMMIVWVQETIIPKAIREGVDVEGMTAVSAYVADRRGRKPNDFKEMAVTELEQEGVIPTGVGGNILKIDEILENVKFVTKSHMDEIRDYMSNEIIDGLCGSITNKWVSDRVKSVLSGWYSDEANAYMPAVQYETKHFLKPYASNVCRDVLRRADELKHGK